MRCEKMRIMIFSALITALILAAGCSNGTSNPTVPNTDCQIPVADNRDTKNHEFQGVFELNFNPDNLEVRIIPSRESMGHVSVRSLLPAPTFDVISYDPVRGILNVNATINNPFSINGYDLRLIVFTDDLGVRLMNPDVWTSLFDVPGGSQINPFKAYAKNKQNRIFEGQTQNTETLQLYMPGGYTMLSFAIDVSYPSNCEEPYGIENFTQVDVLTDVAGSSVEITVDILDWQGNVKDVNLYCPSITGQPLVSLSHINLETWGATIINSTGISAGDYVGYIIATSLNSGSLAIYDDILITVKEETGWARTWGGTGWENADDVIVDALGNVVVLGWYENTVDFDPGPENVSRTSLGRADVYFSKFDQNGNFKWVYTFGGNEDDVAYALEVDNSGNVYVTGLFCATVDFDPGSGVEERSSNGGSDSFLLKVDNDGDFLWVKSWGSISGDEWGIGIVIDSMNYAYVVGSFRGLVDFNPDSGVDTHGSNGLSDAYLSKFSENGDYQWALTWGGISTDDARWIAIDNSDNLYVTGVFCNQVDFNPLPGTETRTSQGSYDFYLSKFDITPNFIWVRTWGGVGEEEPQCVRTDNSSNIIVSGMFGGTADFDPGDGIDQHISEGDGDVCVSIFDPDGNFLWAETWGSQTDDIARGIGTDSENNIYLIGSWNSDFAFIYKVDSSGETIWEKTWGDTTSYIRGHAVNKDCTKRIYAVGLFTDVIDFKPGPDVENHSSNGEDDAFFMKLLPNGYWE